MNYVEAASAAEIAPGTMRAAEAGGVKLLVANVDGTLHAMRRNCPHMGADLCKGRLDGAIVTCRMHEAQFDVTTGRPIDRPEQAHLKMLPSEPTRFPVKIEDGKVLVGV